MSALLPKLNAEELNVFAEYGYTTRSFNKIPRVPQCADYKSAMFLVYNTDQLLVNRQPLYRNHYSMYCNDETVLIVRSETTLIYTDHDATLLYDVITPITQYRTVAGKWTISFDKITYSNKKISFLTFHLVSSGKWWYFDRGIVLNGVTAFFPERRHTPCSNRLIYYELHPKFLIRTMPCNRPSRPPVGSIRLLDLASSSMPATAHMPNALGKGSRRFISTVARRNNVGSHVSYSDSGTSTSNAMSTQKETVNNTTNESPPARNDRVEVEPNRTNVTLSTIDSGVTSILNSVARGTIRGNDTCEVPDIEYSSVVPSLFWFDTRARELESRDIQYFLPLNHHCHIQTRAISQ